MREARIRRSAGKRIRTRRRERKRMDGKRPGALAALALSGLLCLGSPICGPGAGCPDDFQPVVLPEFLFGLSQTPADAAAIAHEVGARYLRPTLSWRVIEPTVQPTGQTVDTLRANPALVAQFAASRDWSSFDQRLGDIVAEGLVPIPIVGHGYTGTLPLRDGVPAAPDVLGREEYLARQYLFTRAVVERYDGDGVDDAPNGVSLDLWQTENELNGAAIAALIGWRTPGGLFDTDTAWRDFDFLTALLTTLRAGVKGSDPEAPTMLNFFTDLHPNFAALLGQPTWQEAVRRWRGLVDIVGFGTYPNYYQAGPVDGGIVGAKAREIRSLACAGQPVVVVETGYPNLPSQRGFSSAR